jgi:guanylate kinase
MVTTTTRQPLEGELDGTDHQYIVSDEFLERVERSEFLECALCTETIIMAFHSQTSRPPYRQELAHFWESLWRELSTF